MNLPFSTILVAFKPTSLIKGMDRDANTSSAYQKLEIEPNNSKSDHNGVCNMRENIYLCEWTWSMLIWIWYLNWRNGDFIAWWWETMRLSLDRKPGIGIWYLTPHTISPFLYRSVSKMKMEGFFRAGNEWKWTCTVILFFKAKYLGQTNSPPKFPFIKPKCYQAKLFLQLSHPAKHTT